MDREIRLTELKCVCGARLRVQSEHASGASVASYRFRCSTCEAVRPALGSVLEVSRYEDGRWKRLRAAEWQSKSWRGRPATQR